MKQIFPDLWQTEVESPFPGLTTHAYLLTRKQGNVLFYNTGHVHEIDAMAELGGVDWHFLSTWMSSVSRFYGCVSATARNWEDLSANVRLSRKFWSRTCCSRSGKHSLAGLR